MHHAQGINEILTEAAGKCKRNEQPAAGRERNAAKKAALVKEAALSGDRIFSALDP